MGQIPPSLSGQQFGITAVLMMMEEVVSINSLALFNIKDSIFTQPVTWDFPYNVSVKEILNPTKLFKNPWKSGQFLKKKCMDFWCMAILPCSSLFTYRQRNFI